MVINCACGSLKTVVFAGPHLDKNDRRALLHNNVYLAILAAYIARQSCQALSYQVALRAIFCFFANLLVHIGNCS